MNSEKTPTFKELIEAIDPHFPDWDVSFYEFRRTAHFDRQDGACFTLYAHSMYRLDVSGLYPIDPLYYDLTNGKPRPRLFITTDKHTPEAIAEIIQRRFLLRYLPIFEACQAKQRELAEVERKQAAFILKQERLHRAAPDLLAALQDLLFYAEIHSASDRTLDLSEHFEAARSAIAWATEDNPAT